MRRRMVTGKDLMIGRERGKARRYDSRERDLNPVSEQSGYDSGVMDDFSALSEYLFAVDFGFSLPPTSGTFHDYPDVGPFEIRTTELKNRNLLVRAADFKASPSTGYVPADSQFVLVTFESEDGTYDGIKWVTFHGWIWGYEAPDLAFRMLAEYGKDDAWLVKPEQLRPLGEAWLLADD